MLPVKVTIGLFLMVCLFFCLFFISISVHISYAISHQGSMFQYIKTLFGKINKLQVISINMTVIIKCICNIFIHISCNDDLFRVFKIEGLANLRVIIISSLRKLSTWIFSHSRWNIINTTHFCFNNVKSFRKIICN